jgi:hypothetical protein
MYCASIIRQAEEDEILLPCCLGVVGGEIDLLTLKSWC